MRSMLAVKAAKSGIASKDFLQTCGGMIELLKLDPVVTNPALPHFCTAGRHGLLVEKAEDGNTFCDLVTIEAMGVPP